MLQVKNLSFDYDYNPLLENVSFHLHQGTVLHIKGQNGRGKTTLLKLIAGLYTPLTGEILSKVKCCYIGHKLGLHPTLSTRENYRYSLSSNKDLVDAFGLGKHLDSPLKLLSSGQKKQAALLQLWRTDAPLWLLDEPLVALDDKAQDILMEKIKHHRAKGGAVLLTSHQALPLESYEVYTL